MVDRADLDELKANALKTFQTNSIEQSEKICRQILLHWPDEFNIVQLLAIITALQSNLKESEFLHGQAVKFPEANSQTHYNYGLVLQGLGKYQQAIASYDFAIRLKPDFSTAYNNRGIAFQKIAQFEEAIASFDGALKCQPAYAQAYFNKGVVLQELGQLNESITCYGQALKLIPDYPEAYNNRGLAFAAINQFGEAITNYEQAIVWRPDYAEAHNNKGLVLEQSGEMVQAIECYTRAIAYRPDYAGAHNNIGNALKEIKLLELAKRHFENALSIDPGFVEAKVNQSFVLLLGGDFLAGFAQYEWRWQNPASKLKIREFGKPLWLGSESLQNKKILLHTEQGLGDSIQFVRYFFDVANLGAEILFECEKSLIELFKPFTPFVTIVGKGESLPEFDYHCPLMSLPLAFKTKINSVPVPIPYLFAEYDRIKKWRSYIGNTGYKIAICWQGSPKGKVDIGRSFPVSYFAKISKIPGVRLISLQKNEGLEQLNQFTGDLSIETLPIDFDSGGSAFLDSAAVISCVDLVITSDTALTHLAGAMGIRTWLALKYVPDWRWLLDRDDSPWYPNHRLFRQNAISDWSNVFLEMESELKTLLNKDIKNSDGEKKFETPFVPISWGELIDKITILELKKLNIAGLKAQVNVEKELQYLNAIIENDIQLKEMIHPLRSELRDVNAALWDVEDRIREKESALNFDNDFVMLARSVYQLNDKRALLKKKINQLLNSELIEEKSYKN